MVCLLLQSLIPNCCLTSDNPLGEDWLVMVTRKGTLVLCSSTFKKPFQHSSLSHLLRRASFNGRFFAATDDSPNLAKWGNSSQEIGYSPFLALQPKCVGSVYICTNEQFDCFTLQQWNTNPTIEDIGLPPQQEEEGYTLGRYVRGMNGEIPSSVSRTSSVSKVACSHVWECCRTPQHLSPHKVPELCRVCVWNRNGTPKPKPTPS